MNVAALDVLNEAVQGLIHAAVVDRQRVRVARAGAGAERQHERVVLDRLPGLGVNGVCVGVDVAQLVSQQLRPGIAGDPLQGIAAGSAVAERLANGHRAVDELWIGRDEGHVGELRRDVRKGQRALKGGHSPASDEHAKLLGVWSGTHVQEARPRPWNRQPRKTAVLKGKLLCERA